MPDTDRAIETRHDATVRARLALMIIGLLLIVIFVLPLMLGTLGFLVAFGVALIDEGRRALRGFSLSSLVLAGILLVATSWLGWWFITARGRRIRRLVSRIVG